MKKEISKIAIALTAITTLAINSQAFAWEQGTIDNTSISATIQSNYLKSEKPTIAIALPEKDINSLTKINLEQIIENKGIKSKVNSIVKNGKIVTKNDENIGTDTKIVTNSGEEITVVLFGDVNKDGIVNVIDSLLISEYDVGNIEINGEAERKAANVVSYKTQNEDDISIRDALRIAYFDNNLLGEEGAGTSIVDEELFPDDNNLKADIKVKITEGKEENEEFTSLEDGILNGVAVQCSDGKYKLTYSILINNTKINSVIKIVYIDKEGYEVTENVPYSEFKSGEITRTVELLETDGDQKIEIYADLDGNGDTYEESIYTIDYSGISFQK